MAHYPLNIAFLWHMHQPLYKNPFSGVYTLPWVRLHGVKDYLDTLTILEEFPDIRQTFNVVPSLLEQLNDYTENSAADRHLELTLKSPSDLTADEKMFVVEYFFLANWDTMVRPYQRYYELLLKRGLRYSKADISRTIRYFTEQDIRDLQVLFNLSWIDPMFRDRDPFLKGLIQKQRDYTEEEKVTLINKQFEILKQIIPEYSKLAASGQIDISVSPFYHPILPLLWNTDSARIAMPRVKLPKRRFSHPEDAIQQIRMGLSFFEKTFGFVPKGMWPSEGSVSEEVAAAISAEGIQWIATDEEVLSRSVDKPLRNNEGNVIDADALYRPYRYAGLSLFFRDHRLSDQIGFVYSGWSAEKAVEDFIGKLAQIRDSMPTDRPHIVPVILDGENAWEYYQNDGQDFLRALYAALSNDQRFKTVTMSDYILEHGKGEELNKLHAGSWINSDFHVWIGHEEDNLAWDYLSQARDDLEAHAKSHPDAELAEAWKAIYAAEGSDWNWWYGDEHTTESAVEFDELFRGYLMKVYTVIGSAVPPNLYVPILLEDRKAVPETGSRGFIYPKIDGVITSYFEWHNSAHLEVKKGGGSMHKSEGCIKEVYYGFNKDSLYIRVDPVIPFDRFEETISLQIEIFHPSVLKIIYDPIANDTAVWESRDEAWIKTDVGLEAASVDIFEIGVPFSVLGAKENDEIHFALEIVKNGATSKPAKESTSTFEKSMERCPWRGHIIMTVPSPDFEKIMWY
jgi:alpha-amylase/alpha-mannosidase (GH57 family)